MANFYMVLEEIIKSYINIKYDDNTENLFEMGPPFLVAAVAIYFAG
jgi:hypothetical protein